LHREDAVLGIKVCVDVMNQLGGLNVVMEH
jgi:hypothetical protein